MKNIIISEDMSLKTFEKDIIEEMQQGLEFYDKELVKIRTNRVHPSLIENVKISVYGNTMILKNMAVISNLDALSLSINPFDVSTLHDIEKALSQDVTLGGQIKNDGKIIRITFPSMSKERRQELVKLMMKKKEETIVSLRKVRQDVLNLCKEAEKKKKISEDLNKRLSKVVQTCLDTMFDKVEQITIKKEKSINE